MKTRGVDVNNDWLFGKGRNDYRSDNDAIAQNIRTRLQCFLNDCFFDMRSGIDWFNLLGSKNITGLKLSLSATILTTEGVLRLLQTSTALDNNRQLVVSYTVQTIFSTTSDVFTFSPISPSTGGT